MPDDVNLTPAGDAVAAERDGLYGSAAKEYMQAAREAACIETKIYYEGKARECLARIEKENPDAQPPA